MAERRRASLRAGRPQDVDAIAAIWHRGWRDGHLGLVPEELVAARTERSFRGRAAERVGEMTLAEVDGAIAGFVLVSGGEVEQVYVATGHRGSGVADLLLREAERLVAANGHARAWLAVVPGNGRARAFYERNGWRDEGPFLYPAPTGDGPIPLSCRRYTKQV
jgi:ribosomal protein S18 acetylase RimI-like enzyme